MKRLLCFCLVLLTFTLAWPHAPPVVMDPGITVEFLADAVDADFEIVPDYTYESIELDQVALPLMFEAVSIPVTTLFVNSGTLDVNYVFYTRLNATQEIICLIELNKPINLNTDSWQSSDRLFLAIMIYTTDIEGLSRLDIGEYPAVHV